jgi:glycosyltransferase involved in cell wall biosynthesis
MIESSVRGPANVAPVSVVIPCWRSSTTIERAVASVAAQTLRPAEVLLIDDASGDTTLETLHLMAAAYPQGWVKVLRLSQNAGPGGARNLGWEAATQPWLAFLDADDAWHPVKLEHQLRWLADHPDAALCGHGTALATHDHEHPQVPGQPKGWRVSFLHMLVSNRFPTRSVLLRRSLPFRFGSREVTEDYQLWLEVILGGHACYRIESPLAISFREEHSPGGYSGQLWLHEKRELRAWLALRRQGEISSFTAGIALAWSLIKYVRRALRSRNEMKMTNIWPARSL